MWEFLNNNASLLEIKLIQHLYLALSSTVFAIAIGVPLGIIILNHPRLRQITLGITSIFQTIPSLALLAFLIPFLGIGIKPTIFTLTLYALLPITRNTYTGLTTVPNASIQAAHAMGFTRLQRLYLIELPLALSIIIAGIRTATAMTVGITTIAAFIGAGGLGDFITQGLSLNNNCLILLGAIPTAFLALSLDFIIANVEKSLSFRQRRKMIFKRTQFTATFILIAIILYLIIQVVISSWMTTKKNTITIGTKNFSEQYLLGYLMSDLIESKTKFRVIKKFNLGNTTILQKAMLNHEVDLYPEYTGTGYIVVLKRKKIVSPEKTYQIVRHMYEKKFNLIWLPPFGFSNSETLATSYLLAKRYHLKTLSDLAPIAPNLTLAAPPEFLKRPDGLPGLSKMYQLRFKRIIQMQPDLMYQAIKHNKADVIEAFTSDTRIIAYHLVLLEDNLHLYPPYYAAPIIQKSLLINYPEIITALKPLFGLLDQETIQHLNYLVEVKHQTPKRVAHDFLIRKHLIS